LLWREIGRCGPGSLRRLGYSRYTVLCRCDCCHTCADPGYTTKQDIAELTAFGTQILPVVPAIVVLTVCPEWPTYNSSRTAHILTVAVGALVVFIPLRLFLLELMPNGSDVYGETTTFGTRREWTLLLVGVAVYLCDFWPVVRKAIGPMHLPDFLIAYAVLGAPLGFARRLKKSIQNAQADE
jgi:hypothetical protein